MKRVRRWILCMAIIPMVGCSSTGELQADPTRALYGYASGDKALVIWGDDSATPGEKEWILISEIDGIGVTGTGRDGREIDAAYGEFEAFGIELVIGLYEPPPSALEKKADKALTNAGHALLGTALVAACTAAIFVNPECFLALVDSLDD
jgi:hypothetical protein